MSDPALNVATDEAAETARADAMSFFIGQAALFLFAANHIAPFDASPEEVQDRVARALRIAIPERSVRDALTGMVAALMDQYRREDPDTLARINAYSPTWKMTPGEPPEPPAFAKREGSAGEAPFVHDK